MSRRFCKRAPSGVSNWCAKCRKPSKPSCRIRIWLNHKGNSGQITVLHRSGMRKILYIEDTENNQILIRRRLEQNGYEVMTADDAEIGLSMAATHQPDLILMDMSLPGLDGWEATRRL